MPDEKRERESNMTWPQIGSLIGSLLIGIAILSWAIVSFFIKRMDSMKTELFNHLGDIKENTAKIGKQTEGQEKRLDRIEHLMNSKRD